MTQKIAKNLMQSSKKIGAIKSDSPRPTVKNGMKWAEDKKPVPCKSDRGNFGFK